ncbi:MAG: ABC transporter substrate-binding protein [Deltaproteobacteria bacterium]|nr:ABC transporter substrate-binding protein [Deltaproteobacteria bacterium]
MIRKLVICLLTTALLSTVPFVEAQQTKKVPRIGYLGTVSSSAGSVRAEAFRQGLRELGYVEGKNIVVEYRWGEGKLDRLHELAKELARLKVDVIVALSPPAARAAKEATRTIPIVIRSTYDPVQDGFVASLARPGGNITGLTSISGELAGKRLELLKETVPRLTRVAVLWNPGQRVDTRNFKEMGAASKALGLRLQSLEARRSEDFEGAFKTATSQRAQALITLRNPLIVGQRKQIAELAAKSRLPAIYDDRQFVEVGGLMSYGANLEDLFRRAAIYVDKILKGTKPADLPVEQPMKFELVINLKTAKQIGLTIPPNVLARVDRVIR